MNLKRSALITSLSIASTFFCPNVLVAREVLGDFPGFSSGSKDLIAKDPIIAPKIFSVRVDPSAGVIRPGEKLVIRVEATPQGTTSATIGNRNIGLQEVSRGLYEGEYVPAMGEWVNGPTIQVAITANGAEAKGEFSFPEVVLGEDPTVLNSAVETVVAPTPLPTATKEPGIGIGIRLGPFSFITGGQSGEEAGRETLCESYPLNSKCTGQQSSVPTQPDSESGEAAGRKALCESYPLNSKCTGQQSSVPTQPIPIATSKSLAANTQTNPTALATHSTSPPIAGNQLDPLMEKITVLIDGQNPGSGVLIRRNGSTYTVLTAAHVVETPDEYNIITPDQKQYPLSYRRVTILSGVDLAIFQFDSSESYSIATLGNSEQVKRGSPVYVGGFPARSAAIPNPVFLFSEGSLVGTGEQDQGYGLIYNNSTRPGMSGGPILNAQGQLIGIHGRGDTLGEIDESGEGGSGGKTGLNLGIPIKTFVDRAKERGINFSLNP